MASSILPMNIRPKPWAGLAGVKEEEFGKPERNIRAGVALIRAITERLRPEDRTPAKIGSIWNFAGRENVNRVGARIQSAFDAKAWTRK